MGFIRGERGGKLNVGQSEMNTGFNRINCAILLNLTRSCALLSDTFQHVINIHVYREKLIEMNAYQNTRKISSHL